MPTFADLTCQHPASPTIAILDTALLRLFPKIPDGARRSLRQPLKRWYRGTIKFLQSTQSTDDDRLFLSVWLSLPSLYRTERREHVGALLCSLRREIDATLLQISLDCGWRHSCALLQVVDWLFGEADRGSPRDTKPDPPLCQCVAHWR